MRCHLDIAGGFRVTFQTGLGNFLSSFKGATDDICVVNVRCLGWHVGPWIVHRFIVPRPKVDNRRSDDNHNADQAKDPKGLSVLHCVAYLLDGIIRFLRLNSRDGQACRVKHFLTNPTLRSDVYQSGDRLSLPPDALYEPNHVLAKS